MNRRSACYKKSDLSVCTRHKDKSLFLSLFLLLSRSPIRAQKITLPSRSLDDSPRIDSDPTVFEIEKETFHLQERLSVIVFDSVLNARDQDF